MSKVEDKNKDFKDKHDGDDWEGHSDGEDEQEVENKIKQEKTNKKPQGLKDLFNAESSNTTTTKQQNYKQGGGYKKPYNKDNKGGYNKDKDSKSGVPKFYNNSKKQEGDRPYDKEQNIPQPKKQYDIEKPQFSGKVQATNQGQGLADKKQITSTVVEEKKKVVEEIQIEKPNFVIPTEGHFVDIDKNTDLYLKNLEQKKPGDNEVKYYEGKDHEGKPKVHKDHTRSYKKNYNNNNNNNSGYAKPTKPKEPEKEYDSDGFEIVNSQQKKNKEPNTYHHHNQQKGDKQYKHNNNYKNKKPYVPREKRNDQAENKEGQETTQETTEPKLNEIGIKGEIKKQEKETVSTTEKKPKGLNDLF